MKIWNKKQILHSLWLNLLFDKGKGEWRDLLSAVPFIKMYVTVDLSCGGRT